jgi:retron-type reverse transcriptase
VKTHGGLFARIVEIENLRRAMEAAARGKRDRAAVARFLNEADEELPRLRHELESGEYTPRRYRQFRVCDPKPRTISCADFRDRVVHHAVCDVIGPLIERRFLFDTYACRKGKGTHRATARAQELARRSKHFLKLDVASFFDSVDHEILLELLARQFREPPLLTLLETFVRAPMAGVPPGKGLPIGNLTSQWFANLYLDGADHLVKETLRIPGYVRYMDDMLLFADSKAALWMAHDALVRFLADERRLNLKTAATRLAPCAEGIPFLGMRVFPGTWRLQRGRFLRTRRRVHGKERACLEGRLSEEQLARSAAAAQGMLSWYGMKGVLPQGMEV